jgi:hypothetical protein
MELLSLQIGRWFVSAVTQRRRGWKRGAASKLIAHLSFDHWWNWLSMAKSSVGEHLEALTSNPVIHDARGVLVTALAAIARERIIVNCLFHAKSHK